MLALRRASMRGRMKVRRVIDKSSHHRHLKNVFVYTHEQIKCERKSYRMLRCLLQMLISKYAVIRTCHIWACRRRILNAFLICCNAFILFKFKPNAGVYTQLQKSKKKSYYKIDVIVRRHKIMEYECECDMRYG